MKERPAHFSWIAALEAWIKQLARFLLTLAYQSEEV
jgi:hypothetical protein